jgi:hypothetical protein
MMLGSKAQASHEHRVANFGLDRLRWRPSWRFRINGLMQRLNIERLLFSEQWLSGQISSLI